MLNRAVYEYDAYGNQTKQTIYAQNLSDARITQYQYANANLPGLLTRETAWNGKQTNYTYMTRWGGFYPEQRGGRRADADHGLYVRLFNNPSSSKLVRGDNNDILRSISTTGWGIWYRPTTPRGKLPTIRITEMVC